MELLNTIPATSRPVILVQRSCAKQDRLCVFNKYIHTHGFENATVDCTRAVVRQRHTDSILPVTRSVRMNRGGTTEKKLTDYREKIQSSGLIKKSHVQSYEKLCLCGNLLQTHCGREYVRKHVVLDPIIKLNV